MCFYVPFLSSATGKVPKGKPLGDGEVSIKQKHLRIKNDQVVRLLLDFNISPSPKTPPPLRARRWLARAWVCQLDKGKFISRPLHCSRDLFRDEARKLVLRYVLGSTLLNY